jgi:hypothetical protein
MRKQPEAGQCGVDGGAILDNASRPSSAVEFFIGSRIVCSHESGKRTPMAKILCVLYPDPEAGYPPNHARDDIPTITTDANGQTAPPAN